MKSVIALLCLVAATSSAAPELEVHEWGTFTSIAGADGRAVPWQATSEDLPSFVYSDHFDCTGLRSCVRSVRGKGQIRALIRMETPVIYFYTPEPLDVSLKVGFPTGRMTEWYPSVWNSTATLLDWGTFRVDPTQRPTLPREPTPNHYYAAREVDAAPVLVKGQRFEVGGPGCTERELEGEVDSELFARELTRSRSTSRLCVTSKPTQEWERFLFYRGVGDFHPPLEAVVSKNDVTVTPTEKLGSALLFERRGNALGVTSFDARAGRQSVSRPALTATPESIRQTVFELLVATGLFEKEARAMVKTWDDSWFVEGLRIFYVVPTARTQALLPLTISPAPKRLVRTIVGRIELLAPELLVEVQAELERLLRRAGLVKNEGNSPNSIAARERAITSIGSALHAKFGRFLPAMLSRLAVDATEDRGSLYRELSDRFAHGPGSVLE
jgi:hypothetical protein